MGPIIVVVEGKKGNGKNSAMIFEVYHFCSHSVVLAGHLAKSDFNWS